MEQRRDFPSELKRRRSSQPVATLSSAPICCRRHQQQQQLQLSQTSYSQQSKWRSRTAPSDTGSPASKNELKVDMNTAGKQMLRPTKKNGQPIRLLLLVLSLLFLLANDSFALKLPTFLSSWRPTQSPNQNFELDLNLNQAQDPLMSSASVHEPETRPRFAALTRTHSHHHHLPLHLFRSIPKSLFGRFLPSSLPVQVAKQSTTPTTTTTSIPMFLDWSTIGNGINSGLERAPQFSMMSHAQPSPQPSASSSNVYHFQATQPIQANHFSIDHQHSAQIEPQKHALGYGDSGEDFATSMAVDSQPTTGGQQDNQQPTGQLQTNETWTNMSDQHEQQKDKSLIVTEANTSSSNNNTSEDMLQLDDKFKSQQLTNSSSSGGNSSSSSLLTNLIGNELARLKHRPEELNTTLNSMGQPLLALLMDQQQSETHNRVVSQGNSSIDSLAVEQQQQQPIENGNGPESGRLESAARAVVVVPPVVGNDELPGNHGEFDTANDESNAFASAAASAAADEQMESFILGPFKGLASDSIVDHHDHDQQRHQQEPPHVYEASRIQQHQQPGASVGMSAMASNLIQQARSLIQMPFTSNSAAGNSAIHTMPASAASHNQQLAGSSANLESSRITGLFRGQQPDYLRAGRQQQEQLIEQAISSAPFFLSPAMTNNNYHRQQQQHQLAHQGPPAWQQTPNFASGTMMMMSNHAIQHNNNNNHQMQQQQRRPKNPFNFNRYFLMPSSTMTSTLGHLHHHHRNPYGQQQQTTTTSAKSVPYFVEQQQHSLKHAIGGSQRPQTGASDNSIGQATGFQLAIEHSSQQPSIGFEQARKKFKSGLYQIEPPRLANTQSASISQQKVAIPGETEMLQQIKEEQEVELADGEPAGDDDDDDNSSSSNNDNEQQLQQTSSGSSTEQPQQQQQPVADFAAKQVGASIGFVAGNSSIDKIHRGKVFNEPISDLMPQIKSTKDKMIAGRAGLDEGGQNVSQARQLKHSEEVTLYEFESPPQQVSTRTRDELRASKGQQQQLLDTQVFTVPYTITMQQNGQVSHSSTTAKMHPHYNNFPQHREPPSAHSFISRTWTQPPGQRFFSAAPQPAQLPQLQYLAPPSVRQNQQLFKSVFLEAQQLAGRKPDWGQMRSVPALAIIPEQQQQQQHYFHYQPIQVQQQRQSNLAQDRRLQQPSQQLQQVIYELANEPRQAQQQQFAMAIDHGSNQNGASIFTSNQKSVDELPTNNREPPLQPTTTTTTQPPTTSTTTITEASSLATSISSQNQPRKGQSEATSFLPVREDDDDDKTEKLANLRGQSLKQSTDSVGGSSSPSVFCANRAAGLYADESQKCKAYYQCAPTGHQMFRCNNQTQFNQKTQNCDWWYNVNCGGQGVSSDSEQLPQSGPIQSPSQSMSESNDDTTNERQDEPQSVSALSIPEAQQQVAHQTTPSTSNLDTTGSTLAPSDQSTGSTQQQLAPTSSTPIYSSSGEFLTSQQPSEFSARSSTTQDPVFLLPSTTSTSTSAPISATEPMTDSSASQEAQPQVGSQLNDSPAAEQATTTQTVSEPLQQQVADAISFSSSTSISSSGSDDITNEALTTPTSGNTAAPKLSIRSLSSGRVHSSSVEFPAILARFNNVNERQVESSVYSTSANQGSVSYTPMNTHQLTARAFQTTSGGGSDESSQTRPIEKRFGARLQHQPTATSTTAMSSSHRQTDSGLGR